MIILQHMHRSILLLEIIIVVVFLIFHSNLQQRIVAVMVDVLAVCLFQQMYRGV